MRIKRTFLIGLILLLLSLSAFAQVPDPRDSVILESKAVAGDMIGSPAATLRVWITNKDTIIKFGLGLEERNVTSTAYMTLSWPRTFSGVVIPLTNTLTNRGITVNNYHSNNPDSFDIRTLGTGMYAEPPNSARKPLWDIKFDSVIGGSGVIEFDTVNNGGFTIVAVNSSNNPVYMNFLKGFVTPVYTDVRELNTGIIPRHYALSQNYPNPFNANTQITFALPKSGRTKLEIFNVLGQKINTLVDEYLSAGTKIVNWDGRDDRGTAVPSGIYFYQLRSGEFRETKKMLVLK